MRVALSLAGGVVIGIRAVYDFNFFHFLIS